MARLTAPGGTAEVSFRASGELLDVKKTGASQALQARRLDHRADASAADPAAFKITCRSAKPLPLPLGLLEELELLRMQPRAVQRHGLRQLRIGRGVGPRRGRVHLPLRLRNSARAQEGPEKDHAAVH